VEKKSQSCMKEGEIKQEPKEAACQISLKQDYQASILEQCSAKVAPEKSAFKAGAVAVYQGGVT
jgi:hypothetical protein